MSLYLFIYYKHCWLWHFWQHFSLCLLHTIPTFFFHPFTSPSLFALRSLTTLPLTHHPAHSQPLPHFSLPPLLFFSLFSTHYFLRFSNRSFHRMLQPVSLGKGGGLLVFLVRELVRLSGTSYYNDTANNGSSHCASHCVHLFFYRMISASQPSPPSIRAQASSRCCKDTHSHYR